MDIPEEIDFGFRINNREPELQALDLPVEEINIDELKENMDIPYLEQEGTDDWNLSPRSLISNIEKEHTHRKKVDECNISFPIHIYYFKGSWKILDGVHRYTKLLIQGAKTIRVKKVKRSDLKEIGWVS